MIGWLIALSIGAAAGAALGYFGKCSSGACPLTANWKRGALYGAFTGMVFYSISGAGSSASIDASSEHVKRIAPAEFEVEVLRADGLVVVDFYAPWCGPCKQLAPMLDEAAKPLAGKIRFVKLNVDEAPELAQRFQIEGVPTVLFFRNGQVSDRIVGLPDRATLNARLAR